MTCEDAAWLYGTMRVMGELSLTRKEANALWDHAQKCPCHNYPPDWWPPEGQGWRTK